MKRFGLVIALMLGISTMSMAQAEIKFDETVHNFGKISKKNPKQEYTFTFTNVGDKPLIINDAAPSCGCTVANFTKEPVAPGKTGTIQAKFNAEYQQPAHFKKTITVLSNAKTAKVRIYIEGDVEE
ncbi:MAG: DUF1573 domain-containing protein [Prevotella sp.]|nr:DUF1573 domain-containing protein [Prevotella sp.]MBQ9652434.1 DUF1573 domain-containing protein [Prevotella sp.]